MHRSDRVHLKAGEVRQGSLESRLYQSINTHLKVHYTGGERVHLTAGYIREKRLCKMYTRDTVHFKAGYI